MPKTLFNIEPVLPYIAANTLIITPNSRLKNKLLQAYNLQQHDNGLNVWPAPRVFSLQQWLNHCYQQLLDQGQVIAPKGLISAAQRKLLWQQILDADQEGIELINPGKLISDADTAVTTLERWQIHVDDITLDNTQEQRLLKSWLPKFQAQLEQHNLQTFEQQQVAVNHAYKDGQLPTEDRLFVMGFDKIPPLVDTSFKAISSNVTKISPATNQQTTVHRFPSDGIEQEYLDAALWAKQILTSEADASIGVIAPNLGQCRTQLEQAFIRVFEPNYSLAETPRYTLPFNFSTGVPLGTTPVIYDALALLKLNQYEWDLDALINLLHSPFWGPQQHPEFLYQLINTLKKRGRRKLRNTRLRDICNRLANREEFTAKNTNDVPDYPMWLNQSLQQLADSEKRRTKKQLPSRWANAFIEQLELLQWPGHRRLDSNEYQQVTRWYELLESFSQLDHLGVVMTAVEAVDQLIQLSSNEPFQAQTPDSPIQILGILEGAGLSFSHCWVMGLTQSNWPPAPQPNALLPIDLQRQHGMPHASAERELQYAQSLLKHYEHAAKHVIFSYASNDGENHQQPSALITHYPTVTLNLQDHHTLTPQPAVLEWLTVDHAPIISETEKVSLRGGSSIFKNQASNPLAAFVIHRLGAEQLIEPSAAFNPITRGQILHDSLEAIWLQLKDQKTLVAMTDIKRHELVKTEVEKQLNRHQNSEPEVFGRHYIALELERQVGLIQEWLDLEKNRPEFTVLECEASITQDFHGLPLSLRLDRLDQLSTGELIVIDYKTGTPEVSHWSGDYLKEPQLPLYALCYSDDIKALVFAQINRKSIQIKGLGSLTDDHEGITNIAKAERLNLPDDWQQARQHWQSSLQQLAQEFLNGQCPHHYRIKNVERHYEGLDALMRSAEQKELTTLFNNELPETEQDIS